MCQNSIREKPKAQAFVKLNSHLFRFQYCLLWMQLEMSVIKPGAHKPVKCKIKKQYVNIYLKDYLCL